MEWVSKHDIWFAILIAVVVGIVVDFLSVGSRMREGIRILKNKQSEQSIAAIRLRIEQLKEYQRNLVSDRWLYLFALQGICLALTSFSVGAFFWLVGSSAIPLENHPYTISNIKILGLCLIALAGGIAITTFGQIVPNSTKEKVQAVISKMDGEIAKLEQTLDAELKKKIKA